MSDPLVYPDGFPCPLSTSLQRSERRLLSTLAGARQSRVASHDKISTRQITFLLESPAQCVAWLTWGLVTLQNWAAWFSASWPTPEGGTTVQRFIGAPSYPQFQPNFNGWQVQATLQVRGRGVDPVQASNVFRFLNHFQSLRTGNVASAIGPDLALVGAAALSNSQSKFGGNSGEATGPGDEFSAISFLPAIPMGTIDIGSWRIEGFFYQTVDETSAWFSMHGGNSFEAQLGPTTNLSFALAFAVAGGAHGQAGNLGSGAGKPALNVWHHAGMQYDAVNGDLSCFLDGVTFAPTLTGLTGLSDGCDINEIEVLTGVEGSAFASELALRAVTVAELYGTSYTVPTAPFAPLTP